MIHSHPKMFFFLPPFGGGWTGFRTLPSGCFNKILPSTMPCPAICSSKGLMSVIWTLLTSSVSSKLNIYLLAFLTYQASLSLSRIQQLLWLLLFWTFQQVSDFGNELILEPRIAFVNKICQSLSFTKVSFGSKIVDQMVHLLSQFSSQVWYCSIAFLLRPTKRTSKRWVWSKPVY